LQLWWLEQSLFFMLREADEKRMWPSSGRAARSTIFGIQNE